MADKLIFSVFTVFVKTYGRHALYMLHSWHAMLLKYATEMYKLSSVTFINQLANLLKYDTMLMFRFSMMFMFYVHHLS